MADDLRLASDAARGDAKAQRNLMGALVDRVRNLARYLVGNDADGDDVAQLVMIRILRSVGGYRGDGSLKSWADRITARTAFAHLRRRRREALAVARLHEQSRGEQSASGAGQMGDYLLRRRLAHHLDAMREERRTAVVLRVIGGLTLSEIAELTGVPENTAKDRLRVGRAELREALVNDPLLRDVDVEVSP